MSRDNLGIIIVAVDTMIIYAAFFAILMIQYLIKIDVQRQLNTQLQTQLFAVTLTRLPEISERYPLEKLKADLWEHIIKYVKTQE